MLTYNNKFYRYAIAIILVLLIILLLHYTQFAYQPILDFIEALFFPLLLASILYYVLRPFVKIFEDLRLPKPLAILTVYFLVTIALVILSSYVGPILVEQVNAITSSPALQLDQVKEKTEDLVRFLNINIISMSELRNSLAGYLNKIYTLISENVVLAISTITRFAIWLFITPFILYYFLKDDHKIRVLLQNLFPEKYRLEAEMVLRDIDNSLSMFIASQLLVASALGFMLFLGYVAIGLSNAFILALFATLCMTIPIFGSFIALIPALLVALSDSPWMALKVICVMLVAQFIEGNFLSPQILGSRLKIHPLILMLILLASGLLYGVLGLFLATPILGIVRVIFTNGLAYYRQRFPKPEDETTA
jgi:predicted PurR-regulated permease PerM